MRPTLGHHVGRSDGGVEVDLAGLDLSDEVVGTDDVGAGLLGLTSLLALGEDGDADRLTGAVRQRDGAADVLVALRVSIPQTEVSLNGPRRTWPEQPP